MKSDGGDTGYSLPIRPRIHPEESVQSYVARLAEANHCQQIRWLGDFVNRRLPALVWDEDAVMHVATLVRAEPESFREKAYRVADDCVRTREHTLPKDALATQRAGVCPDCLGELGYRPWFWDLTAMEACPDHRVRLVRTCPACGGDVSQLGPAVAECACGYDLRSAVAEPAPTDEIDLAAWTRAVIRGASFAPAEDGPNLDLYGFLELMAVLGRLHVFAEGASRSSGATLRRTDAAAVLACGLAAAKNWPDGMFALIDHVRARTSGGSGLATSIRPLYWAIRRMKSKRAYDLLTQATVAYLREHNMAVPVFLAPDDEGFVDRKEMLERLGIGRWRFERAVAEGRFWLTRYWRSDGRAVFSIQEIERAREGLLSAMSTADFRRTVGVFPNQARELLDTGLFYVDGNPEAGIDRERVDSFLASVEPKNDGSGIFGQEISFGDLRRAARRRGLGLSEIVRLIWNMELPVIRQDQGESLFGRLVFDKAQAMAVLDRCAAAPSGYMSLNEVETDLGLRRAEVNDLRHQGILEDVEVDMGGRTRTMVARKQVAAFKEKYVAKRRVYSGSDGKLHSVLKPGAGLEDAVVFRVGQRGHPILDRTKLNGD